jgi:hypothetical protein
MTSPLCELCNKNERYHICTESNNQHLCLTCFNRLHFGINAPRTGKSMVYNKCIFCNMTGDNATMMAGNMTAGNTTGGDWTN